MTVKSEELSLGQKIKNFRLRANLSQFELEDRIGASPGSLSRIENGQINPTKETLIKITDVLNLNAEESGLLFGINFGPSLESVVQSAKALNAKLDLEYVLQSAVDQIVYELELLAGFITLAEGDKLYAKAATNNWITRLALKFVPAPIYTLNVSLTKDTDNYMVRSFLEKRILMSEHLYDFVVPAVNRAVSDILQKVSNGKSGVSLPIIYDDNPIGVIFFNKNYTSDFSKEMDILKTFAEHIGIAVNNAMKYEELNNKYLALKNKYER